MTNNTCPPRRSAYVAAVALLLALTTSGCTGVLNSPPPTASSQPSATAPTASPTSTRSPTATRTPGPTDGARPSPSPGASAVPIPEATPTADRCTAEWDTGLEANPVMTSSPIINVRSGSHACFDRLVVDVQGTPPGYHVQYVAEVVRDGSGEPVPLRGEAFLQFIVLAPAYNVETGESIYAPADDREVVDVSGSSVIRQVAYAGSFEGQTTFGVGVESALPFRVFTLAGPDDRSRVVLDVARSD